MKLTAAQKITLGQLTLAGSEGKQSRLLAALKRKYKSPKDAMRALGIDEDLLNPTMAYDQGAPRFSKARAVAWLLKQGCDEADIDEFLSLFDGGGADQGGEVAGSNAHNLIEKVPNGADGTRRRIGDHATSAVHNRMEMAARSDPMEMDEIPAYGRNHLPRPALEGALDEALPRSAACRIAPGLANIRMGFGDMWGR